MAVVGAIVDIGSGVFEVKIVAIEHYAVCVGRRRLARFIGFAGLIAAFLFNPTSLNQTIKRPLHRGAPAADLAGHLYLASTAPTRLVGVAAQQAKDLQVAALQAAVEYCAGRDDG